MSLTLPLLSSLQVAARAAMKCLLLRTFTWLWKRCCQGRGVWTLWSAARWVSGKLGSTCTAAGYSNQGLFDSMLRVQLKKDA
jgi:hypothetical protein